VKHSIARGDVVVLVAVYFILLKLMLVVALAMLFSCFTFAAAGDFVYRRLVPGGAFRFRVARLAANELDAADAEVF
jgi:hypothetical protein